MAPTLSRILSDEDPAAPTLCAMPFTEDPVAPTTRQVTVDSIIPLISRSPST